MRHLTFLGPRHVEWRDAPEPTLQGDAEALVRPIAVATCDLDAAIVRGQSPFTAPFALGHEFIAEVLETGVAVRTVSPGTVWRYPSSLAAGPAPSAVGVLRPIASRSLEHRWTESAPLVETGEARCRMSSGCPSPTTCW